MRHNFTVHDGGRGKLPPAGLEGGGDGPHDGGMEARVAKLEAASEFIRTDIADIKGDIRTLRDQARTDFRILFGATITTTLALAGLMAKGFGWL
jgi:hypothetical protein